MRKNLSSPPLTKGFLRLTLSVPVDDGATLIVLPAPASQAQFDLGDMSRNVQLQRDYSAAFLSHVSDNVLNLVSVEQQLSGTKRLVIVE